MSKDSDVWMWGQACELMDEAERLRQQFFTPGRTRRASWEPPADVLESEDQLWVIVALPGVAADQVEVVIDGGTLVVAGQRPMPRVKEVDTLRLFYTLRFLLLGALFTWLRSARPSADRGVPARPSPESR